jgi:hypothetical protein
MVKMSDEKERQSSDAHRSHDERIHDLPPDPDAHLTAEEKSEVVRRPLWGGSSSRILGRKEHRVLTYLRHTGPQASLEA